MSFTLLLPTAAGVLVGLIAGRLQRRLQPSQATIGFTLLTAIVALAVVAVVGSLALLFISTLLPWCRALAERHDLPVWAGMSALAAALVMAASMRPAFRRLRAHRGLVHGESFLVLPTDEPAAFAVPGDPGCVVVSAGMLRALDADERRALLAHERAHLQRHHHRYLWVTAVASTMVPVLRPLANRVRFATERWADEDAAVVVGDRKLVARALCHAALAQGAYPGPAMSLARFGVPARVEALLADARPAVHIRRIWLLGLLSATALTAIASSVQLHHLATFALRLCPVT